VVLDHVIVWKQLGCFEQHRFGILNAAAVCPT
jgi:hypothetical protein